MSTPASRSLAHALGWTLLHFCWQGALIAVLLACILSLLSGRSSKVRYLACCLALLMMAVMPLLTYVRLVTASRSDTKTVLLPFARSAGLTVQVTAPSEPVLSQLLRGLDHSLPVVLTFWCVGVLMVFSRLGIGLIVAHRMKSSATATLSQEVQVLFEQLLCRLAITRQVKLLTSALVQVPTLIGWVQPVVLLPLSCLSGLSRMQLEAILLHELAHVRRHDYLINVLQSVVEALLFYHPAVWWVSRSIRRERENCCDDIAVTIAGDALAYARALSLLEEHRSNIPQPILEATGGSLVMRIKRLIGMKDKPAFPHFAAVVVLTLIITGVAVGASTFARAQPGMAVQNTTSADSVPALPSEYRKWLDEDVRWNITPAERTVFLHLSSDVERDKFIQQFWIRRDPAGAPQDSARMEHYKRIAYANQHFKAARPGWETDRGRIYILYGPPTSIDAHAAATSSANSYEVWDYDNALELGQPVELKFVDTCRCGDYELSQEPEAATTSSGLPDKALYEKGLAQMDHANYEVARLSLQTLINAYPSSAFAKSAQLAIATSWDEQGDAAALREAERAYDEANVTPHSIGGSVSAPALIFAVEPEYSESARAAKEQGNVLVNLWVDDQGRPSHVRVVKGLAKDLDDKAIEAVRKYRFKPAMENGTPVLVAVNVDVNFQLF